MKSSEKYQTCSCGETYPQSHVYCFACGKKTPIGAMGCLAFLAITIFSTPLLGGVLLLDKLVVQSLEHGLFSLSSEETAEALQTIGRAQKSYYERYKAYASSLEELGKAGLIEEDLSRGARGNYLFRMREGSDGKGFVIVALMTGRSETAGEVRHFYLDHRGTLTSTTRSMMPHGKSPTWSE